VINGRHILAERQDIVYRAPANERAAPVTMPAAAEPSAEATRVWQVVADSTLLMRYSAMTFNGHRIHYDEPYATTIEGYPGLVVHGPLQATLMLNIIADVLGRMPKIFRYRGLAPLISGAAFQVEARALPDGGLSARVISAQGVATMSAAAETG